MGLGEQYEFERTGRIEPENNGFNVVGESLMNTDFKVGKKTIEAIGGNPIHKEFYDLIAQIVDTFQRKNNDYAGSDAQDMMQNFMRCENFGIKMSDGIITRMSDKITRMENLFRTKNQMVKDESLIDTVTDLSVYCLFLVIALKREADAN